MSTESIRLESTSVKLTDYANEPITKDNPLPIDGNISVSVDGGEMVDELETLLTAIKDTDGIKKITDPISIADSSIATATTVTPSDTTDLDAPSNGFTSAFRATLK